MGTYINKGNMAFREARNVEYIDKSGLIVVINGTIDSRRKYSCITRSRRFGKAMAAEMLYAYYDQSCDSRELFADLEIARDPSFEQHLNKYPTIFLDMSDFVTRFKDEGIILKVDEELQEDMQEAYPDVPLREGDDLMKYNTQSALSRSAASSTRRRSPTMPTACCSWASTTTARRSNTVAGLSGFELPSEAPPCFLQNNTCIELGKMG